MPLVQRNALFAPLQLGIANAVGAAADAVGFATTVFAAIDDRPASDTVAHAGADDGPVDTTACPAVDPAGFSSCTGYSVAADAAAAVSAAQIARRKRFMCSDPFSLKSGAQPLFVARLTSPGQRGLLLREFGPHLHECRIVRRLVFGTAAVRIDDFDQERDGHVAHDGLSS
ncbi:hypothetical protein UE98_31720 [Burkholderia cenocepacia]|nr:hypothetical protein UE98_31720 [Burkholderia cenocepacia]